jgi:hypothetical protein
MSFLSRALRRCLSFSHLAGSPSASSSSSSSDFGVQYHADYDAVVSGCSSTNMCIGGEDFAYDASEVLGRYFGTKKAKAVTSFPKTGRKGKGKWETRSQQLTMVAALIGSPFTRCFRRAQVCSGAKEKRYLGDGAVCTGWIDHVYVVRPVPSSFSSFETFFKGGGETGW